MNLHRPSAHPGGVRVVRRSHSTGFHRLVTVGANARARHRRGSPIGTNRWNRGQSMMVVVAIMSTLLILPAALTALSIGEISNSTQSVAADASVTAAEAGLNNYISLIESNSGFDGKNAGNSTYKAFGGTSGQGAWEPINGAPNECYFYETNIPAITSTSVNVTVTGRAGPANNTTTTCPTNASAHYRYKTISATITYQSPGINNYLYLNEYNVANPFIYGGYSGGLNYCGYYAYATNPNWSFMYLGLNVSYGVALDFDFDWQDTVSGYPVVSNGDDSIDGTASWGFIAGPGSVGGALGPSQGGTIFASSGNFNWGGEGVLLALPGISNDYPGVNAWGSPYGNDNSLWNNAQSPLPALWGVNPSVDGIPPNGSGQGGPYSNGNNGNPGTDTYGDASGKGGPNGCQFFGTPFHDGFYTSSYTLTGNYSSPNQNPNGSGVGGNGIVYSNDEYYLCPAYNSNPGNSAAFTNVNLQSGDPYPPATPSTPSGELNPSVLNWTIFGFTIFGLNANVNWQAGPPYYVTGNTGSFTITFFGTSYPNEDIQVCGNSPNPAPSISQATGVNKIYLPKTNPTDYSLSSILSKATSNNDCVYTGNSTGSVTITFAGGTGAAVSLSGGATQVSGPASCVGLNATPAAPGIFFVKDGDAYVSGTVGIGQNYTVAVAGTSPLPLTLPASSQSFPNQVLNSGGGATTLTPSTGPQQGFNSLTDTYPNSIYVTGNITYGGCPAGGTAAPLTTSNCNDYLGLISQNNVVISYPTQTPNAEGSPDTDAKWVVTDSGTPGAPGADRFDAESDGNPQQYDNNHDQSGGSSCEDNCRPSGGWDSNGDGGEYIGQTCTVGGGAKDPDGDGYCNGDGGLLGLGDGGDGDDYSSCVVSDWWGCSISVTKEGTDTDGSWQQSSGQQNDIYWPPNDGDGDSWWSTDNGFAEGCDGDAGCVLGLEWDGGSLSNDNDPNWNWSESDYTHTSNDNDGDTCWTTDSFASSCSAGGSTQTYWGIDGCDTDDINVCITEAWGHGLSGDIDASFQTNDNDAVDNENDSALYAGQTCTIPGAAVDPDTDGYCQGDATNDGAGDSDDTGGATTNTEMGDGNPASFVHTIDADIEAVWGSFMLDKYGYFSNADHSCQVGYFYAGIVNLQNEPSDDWNSGGGGSCQSDGDNDEGALPGGGLTVNGTVSEFWRGILNHFEAYSWTNVVSGGYSSVNFNYDGRFQKFIPAGMPGVGNPTWSPSTQVYETPVCPTGSTDGSGNENVTACPQ